MVVANGKVLASGTPAQLKAAVGTYLRLTVMARSSQNLAAIEARVLELAPGASILRDAGDRMRQFRIPRSDGWAHMSTFVRHLTREGEALGVSDWGTASMSMQEVFLTIVGNVDRVGSTKHAAASASSPSSSSHHQLRHQASTAQTNPSNGHHSPHGGERPGSAC